MRFKKIVRLFEQGNVCVTGLRGTGKDLLFGNVIQRRKKDYVSNVDYGSSLFFRFYKANLLDLDCRNIYRNFITGNINEFQWVYPDGADVYLSDCGVYFPSQYCNELNKMYGGIVTYQALSRQVSFNNFHCNCQSLGRVWDKIREQSGVYIRCRKCFYLFGYVLQFITIYDKYDSCLARVQPCRVHVPLLNAPARAMAQTYIDNFFNVHGSVKNRILFYKNRSKHDTYYFRYLMGGKKNEKKSIIQRFKAVFSPYLRLYRVPWEYLLFLSEKSK